MNPCYFTICTLNPKLFSGVYNGFGAIWHPSLARRYLAPLEGTFSDTLLCTIR